MENKKPYSINYEALNDFVFQYYAGKDIMHDLTHIERVLKTLVGLKKHINQKIDNEAVLYAAYFHGFIYLDEKAIRNWLADQKFSTGRIDFIVKIAWESQKSEDAETTEGKLLHDAHIIEGGKTFWLIKSLITGSVRDQSLDETIEYFESNLLNGAKCYFEKSKEVHQQALGFAKEVIRDLKNGISGIF